MNKDKLNILLSTIPFMWSFYISKHIKNHMFFSGGVEFEGGFQFLHGIITVGVIIILIIILVFIFVHFRRKKQSRKNSIKSNKIVNQSTVSMYEEIDLDEINEGTLLSTITEETSEGGIYDAPMVNVKNGNLEETPENPIYDLPTANDNFKNRYSEFLLYCIAEFNQYACLAILVSTDKDNAKTGQLSKYLSQAVESGLTAGIALSGVPIGATIGKGTGKVSGEIVGGLIKEYEKSREHKKGKLAEHMLKSFIPDDPKWISFLLDCFSDIFVW